MEHIEVQVGVLGGGGGGVGEKSEIGGSCVAIQEGNHGEGLSLGC